MNRDPISPRVEVRAFAGPMTKTQAVDFRKKWKTPPRVFPKKGQGDAPGIMNSPITLRLQDTEKGLERVGRYAYLTAKDRDNIDNDWLSSMIKSFSQC